MTYLQNTIKRLEIIVIVFWKSFANDHQSHILELVFPIKFAPNPIVVQNMANLQHTLTSLLFTVFFWSIFAYHASNIFGVLTVKFLLNQFTTHKMASLENIATRLRIIVLCYLYSAYHQNDTLELLP